MTGISRRAEAQLILDSMRAMYSKPFTEVPAREADFPHLDLRAYARARADFESRGFRFLEDTEILEVTNSPGSLIARTMVRHMLSTDGQLVAGYYQVRPRVGRVLWSLFQGLLNLRWIDMPLFALKMLRTRHCFGIESELSDGTFVTTSNAEAASDLLQPLTIDMAIHPYGTPLDVLLEDHHRRLRSRLEEPPGRSVRVITSPEEERQMGLRLHALKNEYRAAVGWVTRAELRAMSTDALLADEIYDEIQKLLAAGEPKREA